MSVDTALADELSFSLYAILRSIYPRLNPIERARSIRRLMVLTGSSDRRIARELSMPPREVARILALLELPQSARESVEQEELPAASAYLISRLLDPLDQATLADRAVFEGLTTRQVFEAVRAAPGGCKDLEDVQGPGPLEAYVYLLVEDVKLTVEAGRDLDHLDMIQVAEDFLEVVRFEGPQPSDLPEEA